MRAPSPARLPSSLAVLAAAFLLVGIPSLATGQPSVRPRTALVAPGSIQAPRREMTARKTELEACAPPHPYTTPFDGRLALRSAYRTARPHVYQFCPRWSGFGPVRGARAHGGIDIAQPTGTPVRAAVAGMLSYAHDPGGYGRFARLRFHAPKRAKDGTCSATEEIEIIYGHLEEELPKAPSPPRLVRAGEIIGHVGCTGNAKGMCSPSPESHLHVTVERAQSRARLDPIAFLGWHVAEPTEAEKPADLVACGKER